MRQANSWRAFMCVCFGQAQMSAMMLPLFPFTPREREKGRFVFQAKKLFKVRTVPLGRYLLHHHLVSCY